MFRAFALACVLSLGLFKSDAVSAEILPAAKPEILDESLIGPRREQPVEGDVPARLVTERGVENLRAFARLYGLVRWFHPSDAAANADWTNIALAGIPRVEAARSSSELAAAMLDIFSSLAPTLQVVPGDTLPKSSDSAFTSHLRWRHRGMGIDPAGIYSSARETVSLDGKATEVVEHLPGGISIRLPLAVPVAEDGRTVPPTTSQKFGTGKPEGWVPAGFDRTTRLASTIVAWNLLKHFYPYWDQVPLDWDAALGPALQRAALAPDDRAYHQELRSLLALIRDGHASVRYTPEYVSELPLDWEWVEGQLIVTATDQGAGDIVPGTIVVAIDGTSAKESLAKQVSMISGSPQWQREHALERLRVSDSKTAIAQLTLRAADGKLITAPVPFTPPQRHRFSATRPDVIEEIEPSVLYVDITRLDRDRFADEAHRIGKASALIFDLRGYPEGEHRYLAHMSDRLILSAKMELPEYVAPDGLVDHWDDGTWKVKLKRPGFSGGSYL